MNLNSPLSGTTASNWKYGFTEIPAFISKSTTLEPLKSQVNLFIIDCGILLPSASLGAKNKDGKIRAMYEPIHGSAPDIAGKGAANPIATILSFAMALKYSLDLDKEADALEKAVQTVLDEKLRTKDILSPGMKEVSTSEMGDAIISQLQ